MEGTVSIITDIKRLVIIKGGGGLTNKGGVPLNGLNSSMKTKSS